MELDLNFRDEFSDLSRLLLEYPLKQELTNGLSFEAPSSKPFWFHSFHQLGLLANIDCGSSSSSSSSSNPHHPDHFTTIEDSSKNPFSGISETCTDPLQARAIEFSGDLSVYLSIGFSPDVVDKFLQDFQSKPFFNSPHNCEDRFFHETKTCQPLKFEDFVSISAKIPADDSSCQSAENWHHKPVGAKKDKNLQVKKDSRAYKKINLIKGQWTPEEDRLLVQLVEQHGVKKWSQIARMLDGRVGKQCRERWHNHLRPDIRVSHPSSSITFPFAFLDLC
ncbi:hypothetical protein K2173_020114 [Erythroxylum novogranatense]|uniref:Uncharacterized protein n=1 Tax=Erythroxylum novogranatense TaxID=1862640 RepID=A0AAV8UAW5_9ROSI|nr:hypothetical protein K2173_020114 [Erythroxylum novogranatense]